MSPLSSGSGLSTLACWASRRVPRRHDVTARSLGFDDEIGTVSRPTTNDCRLHLTATVVCAGHGGWKAARPGWAQGGMAGEGEGEGGRPPWGRDDGTMRRSWDDGALVLHYVQRG